MKKEKFKGSNSIPAIEVCHMLTIQNMFNDSKFIYYPIFGSRRYDEYGLTIRKDIESDPVLGRPSKKCKIINAPTMKEIKSRIKTHTMLNKVLNIK